MSIKKQNKNKRFTLKRFFNSIKYSIEGLTYAYKNEQSLWLHGVGSLVIISLGFVLGISFNQWAILIIALVIVLAIELLNTAVEATVDLITKEIHPLAKIAKDCGSAASFVSAIMLVIISLFIFVPYIINIFK